MTNQMPGIPAGGQPHEFQPRFRSEDVVYPLYIDEQGRLAINLAPGLRDLADGSTLAQAITYIRTMRNGDKEILREP